jgi:hypothetical protein
MTTDSLERVPCLWEEHLMKCSPHAFPASQNLAQREGLLARACGLRSVRQNHFGLIVAIRNPSEVWL